MAESVRQQQLDAARQGDAAALGNLLEQFRPYVRALVREAWHGQASARQDDSDLIQDAMLLAHQAFGNFRGTTVAEFAGWLRTLTLRTLGHARRAQVATGKRSVNREQVLEDLDQLPESQAPSADHDALRHEQAAAMAAALEKLPDDMRQVLHGRCFDGASYAALATQMQRSEGALRVLYVRALRRLREELPG